MVKSLSFFFIVISFLSLNYFDGFAQTLKSDSVHVNHYSINLNLVNLSSKTLLGFTDLTMVSKNDGLTNFELDLLKLDVDSVKIDNQIAVFSHNDTVLRINLTSPLDSGIVFHCLVYYHGIPVTDASGWGGFYFQADGSYAYNMGVGMTANPHNYGRVWFPCLDDFIDKSTYEFHITTNTTNTAVCNGILTSVTNNANNTRTFHWNLSQTVSSYLASVAVGSYTQYTDSFYSMAGNYVPIQLFSRPTEAANVIPSFLHLKNMLAAFEYYFGPYKFDRVGYVAVPFSNGAMEHATSIAVGNNTIDGTLNYESLFAHELSHHWFGNLITCSSAADMWLNEGWASYCENLFDDYFYGENQRKNTVRALTKNVIENAHLNDGAFLPVSNVSHENTYGTTVYLKGATVAHSLRGYMGDSLFFLALKQIMIDKSFKSLSSNEFKNLLQNYSNISLTDFFQSWVDEPGFSHFSLDSMKVTPMSSPLFHIDLFLKQKLYHKPNLAQSNKVWVRLMDQNWNVKDVLVTFNGAVGVYGFNCDFMPVAAMVDYNEMLCDAVIDEVKIIKSVALHSFDNSYFKLDVKSSADSSLFRLSHHYVAPDPMYFSHPGFRFSSIHYWTVDGIFAPSFNATGRFQYNRAMFDKDILKLSSDSLVMYYRKDATEKWRPIASTRVGAFQTGSLYVDAIQKGEYALGAWDDQYAGMPNLSTTLNSKVQVTPNPSTSNFKFAFESGVFQSVQIVNSIGSCLLNQTIHHSEKTFEWIAVDCPQGDYFALFSDSHNNVISSIKLLKIK